MNVDEEKHPKADFADAGSLQHGDVGNMGHLHRRLNNRQIQLIAAGGSIGTALFISIGSGLAKGGPGSLLIAYTLYSLVLALVNNSIAEMNTYMPVAGFLAGWNFFLYEALIIPFEITALTFVISFWDDTVTNPGPTAGVCAAVIVCYGRLQAFLKPRSAFKTVYYRFYIFFIVSALAVGIVCAYNDPTLVKIYFGSGSSSSAAASPYVIAMSNLGVKGLPHLVNFLILTSIFSAGNTYTYCATRALYSLALKGHAPQFLRYYNKAGVPVYYFYVVICFPFLSFLQVANGSTKVLGWLISIVTGGSLITFIVISITYINYHKAYIAQGVDQKTEHPYYGYFQPYRAYIALVIQFIIVLTYGYYAFRPRFNVEVFFQNYSMQILAVLLFSGWKLFKRTRYIRPHEVDLVWERPQIEAYENSFTEPPVGFWTEMAQLVGFRRNEKTSAEA
ncbi:hypothetical protein MRS44_009654 [Fusarium solani]|uniref:uncharacterized protein n=1 Tax=Fusarium solani TaxID=169388 RepID=UPI0032C3FF51|nr:hypothetical protein MRS44_009654 [Fusarium solani]